jgi:hypothetical protein
MKSWDGKRDLNFKPCPFCGSSICIKYIGDDIFNSFKRVWLWKTEWQHSYLKFGLF